jgi:alkaline phosphatase D
MTLDRRHWLKAQLALAACAAWPVRAWSQSHARLGTDPFTLGVASGSPAPNEVVLWTRLAPRPLEPCGACRTP